MDISTLTSVIGSLGFPIVACCAMFYSNYKQQVLHKEEISKLAESVTNNTMAITKLTEKIESWGNNE